MGKWIIEKGLVKYVDENGTYSPYAKEIFSCIVGGENESDFILPKMTSNINDDLPDYSFSTISLNPQISLNITNNKIIYEIFTMRRNNKYNVILPDFGGVDYIIIDKRWYSLSEKYWAINNIFKKICVQDPNTISFGLYVKLVEELQSADIDFIVNDSVVDNLKNDMEISQQDIPNTLNATLYPYQETGYKWLEYITNDNCGCILGDEMGLGKTIQVITLFLERKNIKNTPELVIAPVSLLENWKREIEKFAPSINAIVNHGSGRIAYYKDLLAYDVVIISYSNAVSDLSMLQMIEWDLLVLDEAQNIKNPSARRTEFTKMIPHRASIAVTGTPFENHMTDLWSIIDFTIPGLLGSLNEFNQFYGDDIEGAKKIEPILSALMLRRRVADVAKDLPEKVVIDQAIQMDPIEAEKYEQLRQEAVRSSNMLGYLTKLRMICTHPAVYDPGSDMSYPLTKSIKYSRLIEIISEIIWNNEKVIVFTSFTTMINLIKEDMKDRFSVPVYSIYGATPVKERQGIVDEFNNKYGAAIIVLNPKAAGVGLNITGANHVIHYNLEWNPAIEDQATARAYRRGQKKTVFVYRLFYANTVEQVVDEKINMKRDISEAAVVGTDGNEYSKAELYDAFRRSPINGG